MRISGQYKDTFLYLNGLAVPGPVQLSGNIELRPARWSGDGSILRALESSDLDFAAASVFLPRVSSQLSITAPTPREAGTKAWNALWYTILFSAFFDCDTVCNLQADAAAEELNGNHTLQVTNFFFHGIRSPVRQLSGAETLWVEDHMETARRLLGNENYLNAVHALASYRWHTVARARLALLWSGLEGLFRIDTEVVFRLSLYVARFLHPDDAEKRHDVFTDTKRLYKARSKAVHGGSLKGDSKQLIVDSADLLRALLLRCVTVNGLPDPDALAP